MLADALAHIYLASARRRRLYWLALTSGALAVLGLIALFWFDSLQASYADLQERRLTFGNMLRIVEAGSKSESTMAATEAAAGKIFLEGASRSVVAASLQSWLSTAVQEAGAQLQSIENAALPEPEGQSYVGMSANAVGTWGAVQAILYRIETAEPMLTIQTLDLQSYSNGASDSVEPSVTMQISIRGAARDSGS
jgi:hypothetical protein